MTHLLREQPHSLTPEELEELSTATDGKEYTIFFLSRSIHSYCSHTAGYSGADMANLCREAAYGPVREAAETIQHIAADEVQYGDKPVIL